MIFLVWIFFVARADAGTIVLGSMSAGGVQNPKRVIKLTWGAIMEALATILLVVGGLDALQNGAILAATPFAGEDHAPPRGRRTHRPSDLGLIQRRVEEGLLNLTLGALSLCAWAQARPRHRPVR